MKMERGLIFKNIVVDFIVFSDSVRGSLHILVGHTLIEGPDYNKVDLAGLVPGGHLRDELGVDEPICSQVRGVADDLGSDMIQSMEWLIFRYHMLYLLYG